ncbi:MAG: hypothetical protein LBE17_13485 [Treponema sp.]|jgi:hypothetical protein|nr:hypothetical protein [Treponema sp.]
MKTHIVIVEFARKYGVVGAYAITVGACAVAVGAYADGAGAGEFSEIHGTDKRVPNIKEVFMAGGDWLPRREQDLVDLCQKWAAVLGEGAKITAYGWNPADCTAVLNQVNAFLPGSTAARSPARCGAAPRRGFWNCSNSYFSGYRLY